MIILNYKDRRPIYEQVVDRFKELIINRVIYPDTQLPSVRNLAIDLSINPNTIQRAYTLLEQQGFIYSVKGKGSFVAENSHLIQMKKEEIFHSVLLLIREGKNLGITEEQFIIKIKECYKEGLKDD
jgi:GntR family transcriptional regulator